MGTRNLTVVFVDGEYKVAQYGQWDGYPEGQGMKCLRFLRNDMNEDVFREKLKNVRFATEKELDNIFGEFCGKNGYICSEQYSKLYKVHPEMHRDTGAEILNMIQDGDIRLLKKDLFFAADGLFCEWAYVIDLDKRTFEVYTGFHKEPLTEKDRFFFLKDYEANGYSGVHMEASWSIDDLPMDEEFLKAFSLDEDY